MPTKKSTKAATPTVVKLAPGVGVVTVRDGTAHVCELGVCLRLGLGRPIDSDVAAQMFPAFELCPGEERPEPGAMLQGRPVFCWVSQHEAAKLLGLTTRQVQNLETKGLPCVGHRGTKRYALPHLHIWSMEYHARARPAALPYAVAEAELSVRLAEDELAEAEGR
jgi:hypothetical protein